jgi:beta-lactamase class A
MIDRRALLSAGLAFAASAAVGRPDPAAGFMDLRARLGSGARLGLAAIDAGSGRRILFDAESRYAMASTFKLALAAMVLANVDQGRLSLAGKLNVRREDLLGYAPVVHVAGAGARLSIERLCAAIVEVSDNGAANMLLRRVGGPKAMTGFFRRCGDRITRLDRIEPELNSNLPGDKRDTTTPLAMAQSMQAFLTGNPLSIQSKQRLVQWLVRSSRGLDRLRAGLPPRWRVGSKAGTGARGAMNDLAIAWPPGKPPILIACYLDSPHSTDDVRAAVHREVARRIAAAFA